MYYLESNAQADGVHDLFELMAVLIVTIRPILGVFPPLKPLAVPTSKSRRVRALQEKLIWRGKLPPPSCDHVLEIACEGDGGGSGSGVALMEDKSSF